jgi:hypothetical protein
MATILPSKELTVSPKPVFNCIREFQLHQEYQTHHSRCVLQTMYRLDSILEILPDGKEIRSGIFSPNDKERSNSRAMMIDLLWSLDTQSYCIKALNFREWKFNLDLFKEELLMPGSSQDQALLMILQFISQFTTDSVIYNQCLEITNKLNNEIAIHLMAFNKKFRPKYGLFPEKHAFLNRMISFNPAWIFQTVKEKPKYWIQRIIYTYKSLSCDNCKPGAKRVRCAYLLNSLIEFCKLTKILGKNTDEIKFRDLFDYLDNILINIVGTLDEFARNKVFEHLSFFIKKLSENKYNTNVTESDILREPKTSLDIKMVDLLDNDVNGNNDAEVKYIISEVCNNISDEVYQNISTSASGNMELTEAFSFNISTSTSRNIELLEAFSFIVENDLVNLENQIHLYQCVIRNKINWISSSLEPGTTNCLSILASNTVK